MRDSKDLADWILREIASINPYTSKEKTLAFIWATGFLARCCAEMIWRDNHNLAVFNKVREAARQKLKQAPLRNKQ